jgi:hypothetical protein
MRRVVYGRVIGACRLPQQHTLLHAPKFKTFLKAGAIPSSPADIDWSSAAITVIEDIEGNDKWGDCVEAEDAHYIAVLTGNANTLFAYTDAQALADYSAITGFNQNDPSTDQGTDPVADLNYRVTNGYADGSKDAGWALVDATNQAEVQYALAEFGNLKMWFGIPDSIVSGISSLQSGFVWDVSAGAADQNNGHCIGSCGYNPTKILVVAVTAQGLLVMTWGMLGLITWAAVAAWFVPSQGGGMAVRVSMDWVNKKSDTAPSGLDAVAMITAFNQYFGGNVPVPSPSPTPPTPPGPTPPPVPTGPVTLAAAQAAVATAINAADALETRQQAIDAADAGLATLTGWATS